MHAHHLALFHKASFHLTEVANRFFIAFATFCIFAFRDVFCLLLGWMMLIIFIRVCASLRLLSASPEGFLQQDMLS